MEKQMRELLERSYKGSEVIAYIESLEMDNMLLTKENKALTLEGELKCELNHNLQKQVDKLASKLAEFSWFIPCHYACPIGNQEKCKRECDSADTWKEWCMKDE